MTFKVGDLIEPLNSASYVWQGVIGRVTAVHGEYVDIVTVKDRAGHIPGKDYEIFRGEWRLFDSPPAEPEPYEEWFV